MRAEPGQWITKARESARTVPVRIVTVLALTVSSILALTGSSFAAGETDLSAEFGSAHIVASRAGPQGNYAEITATNIEVDSGCIYIKYSMAIQHIPPAFSPSGEHLGPDICYTGTTDRYRQFKADGRVAPTAPWVSEVTVWICQDVKDETDPCSESVDIDNL